MLGFFDKQDYCMNCHFYSCPICIKEIKCKSNNGIHEFKQNLKNSIRLCYINKKNIKYLIYR